MDGGAPPLHMPYRPEYDFDSRLRECEGAIRTSDGWVKGIGAVFGLLIMILGVLGNNYVKNLEERIVAAKEEADAKVVSVRTEAHERRREIWEHAIAPLRTQVQVLTEKADHRDENIKLLNDGLVKQIDNTEILRRMEQVLIELSEKFPERPKPSPYPEGQ